MYEFHGIKWLRDDELDPDDPTRRGPGWSHAYVPVIGPEGDASGTAHVPIYMPRVYKELKRFAIQVYKAAGGTTDNVEFSGWWSSVKSAFKKIAKVVASNKVLRAVAEKGLESAVPGGPSVSDSAAKVLEDLVSKYRGGQSEAAKQIKGFLEQANKGSEKDAKVLDAIRREYTKQQSAGLPALMQTMSSGDVIVYDPIVGARRKMTKKKQKQTNQQRKRQAAQQRKQPQRGQGKRTSPLRNSPQGPVQPGTRAQQLRQGVTPGSRMQPGLRPQAARPAVRPGMAQPGMLRPGMSPGAMQAPLPGYPYGYPQQPYPGMQYPGGYPQQYPASYGPQDYGSPGGGSYYDPEQDADDQADLEAAAEENLARMYAAEDLEQIDPEEEAEDEAAMAGADYYDIGATLNLTPEEAAQWKRLPKEEQDRLKKGKPEEIRARLRSMGVAKQRGQSEQQRGRQRGQQEQKYRADQQKKERERMVAQAKRDREQQSRRTQGQFEALRKKQIEEVNRRSAASKRVNERRAESQEYEDKIAELEDQLERRDLSDDKRVALETQKAAYQNRLQQADKDLVKADLEARRLAYAHRESMAKIRAAQLEAAPPAEPAVYDEERGEEYDTDDPLVLEALQHMQQAVDAEEALEE